MCPLMPKFPWARHWTPSPLRWNVSEELKCENWWIKLYRKSDSHCYMKHTFIYFDIYKTCKCRISPPHYKNFAWVISITTPSCRHVSIGARPFLWPDIKGPSRREGWWREAMEAADSLINQTPRQRGAGLGSDTTHDSSDIDLLLAL